MIAQPDNTPPPAAYIVLISGGTAMQASARVLAEYTNHSCHFLSPFDSGGSSAEFRRHFALPALGDLRSRMLTLSNPHSPLHQQRAACLAQRMDKQVSSPVDTLLHWQEQAADLGQGEHAWDELFDMTVALARRRLPRQFNWPQASLGNLAMAAGMVVGNLSLSAITARLHILLQCRGQARCMVEDNLELKVELESGRQLIGQHRITGKQTQPLNEAIKHIGLCREDAPDEHISCHIDEHARALLENAGLIVFCPGSFYSSIMAQLLPEGVCSAIQQSNARKIYIPNLGLDPELVGCSPQQALDHLQARLNENHAGSTDIDLLVDYRQQSAFAGMTGGGEIHAQALTADGHTHDPHKLVKALMQLARASGLSAL